MLKHMKFILVFTLITIMLTMGAIPTQAFETKSCQIAVNLEVPENFDLPCYAVFFNMDSQEEFTINLIKENNYRGRISVTPGNYLVSQISVVDDVTCKYPFSLGDDFTLVEKNNITIESKLLNYDEIDEQIKEFIESKTETSIEEEPIMEEEEPTPTPPSEVVEEEEEENSVHPLVVFIILIIILIILYIIWYVLIGSNKEE